MPNFPWIEPIPVEFQPHQVFVQIVEGMTDAANGENIVPVAIYLPSTRVAFVLDKKTALGVAANLTKAATGLFLLGPPGPHDNIGNGT